ncbi:MAG: TrbI/VirB10 family protein [Alphaproteobacteria bacterium]|nr:TrbI/VirB10 family protein [Alphaproteobacteria bacterium]
MAHYSGAAYSVDEAEAARRSDLFFKLASSRSPAQAQSQAVARAEAAGASTGEAAPSAFTPDGRTGVGPAQTQAARASTRRSIHPGTIIPASLITAINSQAPGPVIAQVTQSVYDSETGEHIIIPQGARLVGAYTSLSRYGQRRLEIVWERLVLRDGRQIALAEPAVDATGASGLSGRVDNHWGELVAAAALATSINIGAAATQDDETAVLGALELRVEDPVKRAARDGVSRTARDVADRVIERGAAIPPTVHVAAGARVHVLVLRGFSLADDRHPR